MVYLQPCTLLPARNYFQNTFSAFILRSSPSLLTKYNPSPYSFLFFFLQICSSFSFFKYISRFPYLLFFSSMDLIISISKCHEVWSQVNLADIYKITAKFINVLTIFQFCYHCCVRKMKMLLKVDKDRGNDPVCGTMHKKRTPCHHKHLSSPYLCNIYVKSIFIAVFLCLLFLLLLWGSTTSKKTTPLCIWNLILWGSDLKSIRQNWEGGDMAMQSLDWGKICLFWVSSIFMKFCAGHILTNSFESYSNCNMDKKSILDIAVAKLETRWGSRVKYEPKK